MSTSTEMSNASSIVTNSSSVRVEWPIVKKRAFLQPLAAPLTIPVPIGRLPIYWRGPAEREQERARDNGFDIMLDSSF